MAKWGEGDPRWIVEERADATNVNNWHWTEKNATSWSKDKIKSLLNKLEIKDDRYSCQITDVPKIEGEASASNRKAKLIFFYEWVISAEWEGRSEEDDALTKGKIDIPNLSEEYDIDEIEVTVTITKDSSQSHKVKEFMRKTGAIQIKEQLGKYLKELKIEYSQGLILPTKGSESKSSPSAKAQNDTKAKMNQPVTNSKSKAVGVRINCKKITHKEEFMCQASDLYRALTDKQMVSAFTRNEAKIESETGVPFRLFGGIVHGEFTNLVLNERIEMRWRFQHWPDAHYSEVKIEFDQKESTTELQLVQTGVPQDDYDRTKEGWTRYYWQPIKQTFGFGASLY